MDSRELTDLLRRTFDANVRYYQTVVQATVDYIGGLGDLVGQVAPGRRAEPRPAPPPPAKETKKAALVLEAEAGGQGRGAFLIENDLGTTVSTAVTASSLTSPSGETLDAIFRFEPASATLEPGDQMFVQVFVDVDERFEPGGRYSGVITVPGLTGSRVPIVVRRRPTVAAAERKAAPAGKSKTRATRRNRSAKRPTTGKKKKT